MASSKAVRVQPGRPLPASLSLDFLQTLQDPQTRDKHRLYLAEGVRNLVCLVDYGRPLSALVHEQNLRHPLAQMILRRARQSGIPTLAVPGETLRQLAKSKDPQGILAVGDYWDTSLPTVPQKRDLWVGLDSVRTPGNVGTLLRSLEAAGGNRLVLLGKHVDPYDPLVVRASMGSLFAHDITRISPNHLQKWKARHEIIIVGASGGAAHDYRAVRYRKPTLVLLGHERAGLTPGQRSLCDRLVSIPMSGRVDSLNLAMAATVLLFEIRNQRQPCKK